MENLFGHDDSCYECGKAQSIIDFMRRIEMRPQPWQEAVIRAMAHPKFEDGGGWFNQQVMRSKRRQAQQPPWTRVSYRNEHRAPVTTRRPELKVVKFLDDQEDASRLLLGQSYD